MGGTTGASADAVRLEHAQEGLELEARSQHDRRAGAECDVQHELAIGVKEWEEPQHHVVGVHDPKGLSLGQVVHERRVRQLDAFGHAGGSTGIWQQGHVAQRDELHAWQCPERGTETELDRHGVAVGFRVQHEHLTERCATLARPANGPVEHGRPPTTWHPRRQSDWRPPRPWPTDRSS